MQKHIVYFSLGSNKGDKKLNLINAINKLKSSNIEILKISSLYKTEPVGIKNQDDFFNIVIKARTYLPPERLLFKIKEIEKQLGRKNEYRWGPREIDIDILFYDNIKINKDDLIIPHPQIKERNFVLIPLLEIEEDFSLLDTNIKELVVKNSEKVVKLEEKLIT